LAVRVGGGAVGAVADVSAGFSEIGGLIAGFMVALSAAICAASEPDAAASAAAPLLGLTAVALTTAVAAVGVLTVVALTTALGALIAVVPANPVLPVLGVVVGSSG
jgi:hypothetical protein